MNDVNFTYGNIMPTDSDKILNNNNFIDIETTINSMAKPESATKKRSPTYDFTRRHIYKTHLRSTPPAFRF